MRPGDFLGCMGTAHQSPPPTTSAPPLCWIPFAVDNSSGGQVWVPHKNGWGSLDGELLHLSYGKGEIFHVLKQEVNGVMQGGLQKLPLRFASGIMRGRFNPVDGHLYVGGLRGWQTAGVKDGALHRIRYTGIPFETVTHMEVTRRGLKLAFSLPMDRESATDPENYSINRWNYRWSEAYGSDLWSVKDPSMKLSDKGSLTGEPVTISKIEISADGKAVHLQLQDHRPCMQMVTQFNLRTASGNRFQSSLSHTLNAIP